jgi:hypothetical protein
MLSGTQLFDSLEERLRRAEREAAAGTGPAPGAVV